MRAPDPFVLSKALDWLAEGRGVAVATVIQTWGSAPQPVGSQLVIDAEGNFLGSVSGGCVEAEVITEAADVIATGKPKALEFGVEDNTAWSVGLACGGAIRIFVEPLASGRGRSPDGVLPRLISDVEARHKVALVTHLATGARSVAHSPDDLGPDLAPALEDAFRRDQSLAVAGRDGEIFINIFNPTIRLIIVGAVHFPAEPGEKDGDFGTDETGRTGDEQVFHEGEWAGAVARVWKVRRRRCTESRSGAPRSAG